MEKFRGDHFSKLGNYVYRLVDPSDGICFYVGRGARNRCFSHVAAAKKRATKLIEDGDVLNAKEGKFSKILDILNRKQDVEIVIHRHGLTLDQAKLVESVLIDAYPQLKNLVAGEGSDFRSRHAQELIRELGLEEIPVGQDFLMCMNIAGSLDDRGRTVMDAAAYAWNISQKKWNGRKPIVLAYSAKKYGEVLGVFRVKDVVRASEFRTRDTAKFPPVEKITLKALDLEAAPSEIIERYLHKRVPSGWRNSAPTYPDLSKKIGEGYSSSDAIVGNLRI